jgi:hypothetical protein
MPNCDWGRPCDCAECDGDRVEAATYRTGGLCSWCPAPAVMVYTEHTVDRKGMPGIDAHACCRRCFDRRTAQRAAPLRTAG